MSNQQTSCFRNQEVKELCKKLYLSFKYNHMIKFNVEQNYITKEHENLLLSIAIYLVIETKSCVFFLPKNVRFHFYINKQIYVNNDWVY